MLRHGMPMEQLQIVPFKEALFSPEETPKVVIGCFECVFPPNRTDQRHRTTGAHNIRSMVQNDFKGNVQAWS